MSIAAKNASFGAMGLVLGPNPIRKGRPPMGRASNIHRARANSLVWAGICRIRDYGASLCDGVRTRADSLTQSSETEHIQITVVNIKWRPAWLNSCAIGAASGDITPAHAAGF